MQYAGLYTVRVYDESRAIGTPEKYSIGATFRHHVLSSLINSPFKSQEATDIRTSIFSVEVLRVRKLKSIAEWASGCRQR